MTGRQGAARARRGPATAVFAFLLATSILGGCVEQTAPPATKTIHGPAPVSASPVPAGVYRFDAAFSQVIAEGPFQELPFEKQFLVSKVDGVDIEVGVWRPDVPEGRKVPVIVVAGPYFGNQLDARMEQRSRYLLMLTSNFLPHGYAVAAIAVRGSGGSGGCSDLMGAKEAADVDQAITWLGEAPWSNGNVGMIGRSYDGSTPWLVAAKGNPHLRTIVPVSGVPDLYGLMFRNGSSELRGPLLLNAIYYSFFLRSDPLVNDREAQHAAQGIVCPAALEGLGAALFSGATGARDPLGFWAARNHKAAVADKYRGSVLMVQGLQDWNVDPALNLPWADELQHQGIVVHQMLGQWAHEFPDQRTRMGSDATMRWDWAELLLRWFDRWLKEEASVDLGPAVQILQDGGRWRTEEHFPPRDATWTTWHLGTQQRLRHDPGPDGSVLLTPAGLLPSHATSGARSFPIELVRAVFNSETSANDVMVSGLPRLHVKVQPKGTSGHLTAELIEVSITGEERIVGRTIMNLMFADGTETMKPLSPGATIVAKMEFQPLDFVLRAENQLRVRVWQAQDPSLDRLPALPPSPVELLFGTSNDSVLELPIIERPAHVFFDPPRPSQAGAPAKDGTP